MGLRNIFGQRAARWGLLLGMWVLATSAHSAPFEDSMAQRTLALADWSDWADTLQSNA